MSSAPHSTSSATASPDAPLISVVTVNYNCLKWLDRFFPSLQRQTIFHRAEFILVDNESKDGSAEICRQKMMGWTNGVFLPTGGNYGFGGGSNRGADIARGKYLLFINPDVWLEKDCLENLYREAESREIKAGFPVVLDYDSNAIQTLGSRGIDIFSYILEAREKDHLDEVFCIGTFLFIRRDFFKKIGGFDEKFFLYCEELDVSWRTWISGERIALIRSARLHHQAASTGNRVVENRTNESRRFYSNRNQLITILKNANGPLMLLAITHLLLVSAEACVGALASRRFSFINWAFFKPIIDCWRLRRHICEQRRRNRQFRKHGDLWIAWKFLRFGFGRSGDLKRLLKFGIKVDSARPIKPS